ncbi:MAG TPA: hypothetical protein VJT73_09860 [Polyangiaceae bacterium]|nr:hypothetical protein [Polyangiaceae bacterium]
MVPDVRTFAPVTGQCGQIRHSSSECAACIDRACCDKATACQGEPSCPAASECLLACGDDGACRYRCAAFYNRTTAMLDLVTCRETNCSAECGLGCGGFAYPVQGCGACVRSTCCDKAQACAKNNDCLRLDLCRSDCLPGSTECPPVCDARYPKGAGDFAAWLDCRQNTCADACQIGRTWECLDTPQHWPKPKALGNVTFSMNIADLVTEKPYKQATVKACRNTDFMCTTPVDQSMTDDNGLVSLSVPPGSEGFNGYIDITGGDNGEGSAIFPAMWYPQPPIVAGGWRGTTQFVSIASFPRLSIATGATIDPTRGHFAANATDCNFSPAAGVSFIADTADKATQSFYFIGGIPSISATETAAGSPIGGFVNLPAKLVVVDASFKGRPMGQLQFNIRAGTFTTSSFPPAPSP